MISEYKENKNNYQIVKKNVNSFVTSTENFSFKHWFYEWLSLHKYQQSF